MADRSVVYRLMTEGVDKFTGQMRQAGASVADAADRMTSANKAGRDFREGLTTVGNAAGIVGAAAAAGLGAAVLKAADFDQAMSSVQAATMETAENMGDLRQAALDAGAATVFSATEAAAGIENLAKAGVSTEDILGGGLAGALDLAAAGQVDVAFAAEAAATAMTQFNLAGEDVPHIADLLAAAAGKAQGEVSDFAQALNQGGLVASQMGLSIEETTGALAAFASQGLLGSDAGTSLKTMLLRLANPSKESAKLMKDLGIAAYDANGEMVSMAELAGQLQVAFEGKRQSERDAAFATIFGSDAIRAANVLYSEGEKGITGWTKSVDDAGFAAETAATKMDNLKGDWEGLTGALETALIGTGSGSQGPLRSLVQDLTDATNAYNSLPQAAKSATAGILGVTAVAGGSVFVLSRLVTGIASARAAMVSLGIASAVTSRQMMLVRMGAFGAGGVVGGLSLMADESTKTGKAIEGLGLTAGGALLGFSVGGPIGAAIGGGAGALAGLAKAMWDSEGAAASSAPKITALAATYDVLAGSASAANRAIAAGELQQIDGAAEALRNVGISQRDMIDASLGNEAAIKRVNTALREMRTRADEAATSNDIGARLWSGSALSDIGRAEAALDELGITMGDVRREAVANALAVGNWKKEFPGIPKKVLTEISTEGIPQTRSRVLDLIDKYELTGKERKAFLRVFGDVEAGRKADNLGKKADEATRPREVKLTADTGQALSSLRAVKAYMDGLRDKSITLTTIYNRVNAHRAPGATPSSAGPQERAAGGPIYGPGTATSDSIPAYLSNGEYVIRAAAVQKYGKHMFDGLNAMRLAGGGMAGDGIQGTLDQRIEVARLEKTIRDLMRDLKASGKERIGGKSREIAQLELQSAKAQLAAAKAAPALEASRAVLEATQVTLESGLKALSDSLEANNKALGDATAAYDRVAAKAEQAGQASVAGFNTDLFAADSNPWAAGGGGWFANLTKDIAGLTERGGLQTQLADAGLTGDALAAVLAQGKNSDLSALVASGRAAELQSLFNQRATLSASVSASAGQYAYGAEMASAASEVRVLQSQVDLMTAQQAQMIAQNEQLRVALEVGAVDTGVAVATVINTGAAKGHRDRQRNGKGRRGK